MTRRLWLLLLLACGLVLAQQQLLRHRPPRLVRRIPQPIHSGTAALDLAFSRPMQRQSIATSSKLQPDFSHRWLGQDNPLRLVVDAQQGITAAIELSLSGEDQRGQHLTKQRWWWDPRPWIVVSRAVDSGEQLQLLDRAGDWIPLSPIWPQIQNVVPFGNGRGIALVSSNARGEERIWWQRLTPRSIGNRASDLTRPTAHRMKPLLDRDVLFAHLSSNLNGDLLVQTGGFTPGSERIELIEADGTRRQLDLLSSGPMQLLPAGGGLVVPAYNGLTLRPLIDTGKPPQMLPGSRELGAFCAASGRAVLIRHWPDYRRSIELVIPGLAPRQLHLSEQAVLAVACDNSGQRIWAVLGRWQGQKGEHEIVLMDGIGKVLQRRSLAPWTLKAGTPLQLDPVSRQLLMTVTQKSLENGRAALLDADSLEWNQVLPIAIHEAQWLTAG
ncbi:MAG: hypothetical protein CL862_05550 [Cyanobium sp. NAT70]|nr:hypothetical protein [Cyanobium sp. NAT70]|tara:strand:- start:1167 stop:2489 length:1323 start_codon:yes stop_codon:yes gene_type:complete